MVDMVDMDQVEEKEVCFEDEYIFRLFDIFCFSDVYIKVMMMVVMEENQVVVDHIVGVEEDLEVDLAKNDLLFEFVNLCVGFFYFFFFEQVEFHIFIFCNLCYFLKS